MKKNGPSLLGRWLAAPVVAGLFCGAGCAHPPEGAASAGGTLLFDAAGGADWRNHVKVVSDPAGGAGLTLLGERVSRDSCQMTFTKQSGFFTVPAEMRGAVVLRLLVQGEAQIRVALVAGPKIKSYYRLPPATNAWCEVVLPLSEAGGKLAPGDRVNDITLWLKPPAGQSVLEPQARFLLERATFIAHAAAAAP
jgi:hypothetical protein